jgi:hypothetical protein
MNGREARESGLRLNASGAVGRASIAVGSIHPRTASCGGKACCAVRANSVARRRRECATSDYSGNQKSSGVRKQKTSGVPGARTALPPAIIHTFSKKIWLQGSLLGSALSAGITNV